MIKKFRIAALLLAGLVLFMMVFSLFVIAAEADHDCDGDDCPVCAVIAICENTVKALSAVLIFVSLMVSLALSLIRFDGQQQGGYRFLTPVALRVKLTN